MVMRCVVKNIKINKEKVEMNIWLPIEGLIKYLSFLQGGIVHNIISSMAARCIKHIFE
jgi:hypothetical protein